jgi:peptide deformylase
VVFLARHGDQHSIPPHQVNYRANLWALAECAGRYRFGRGGRQHSFRPEAWRSGHPAPDHRLHLGPALDLPRRAGQPRHACRFHRTVRSAAAPAAASRRRQRSVPQLVSDAAVYAATQGPRLETAAEINRLERDGADRRRHDRHARGGLARELALPYAAINVVANYAAGSRRPVVQGSAWKRFIKCPRWSDAPGARDHRNGHAGERTLDDESRMTVSLTPQSPFCRLRERKEGRFVMTSMPGCDFHVMDVTVESRMRLRNSVSPRGVRRGIQGDAPRTIPVMQIGPDCMERRAVATGMNDPVERFVMARPPELSRADFADMDMETMRHLDGAGLAAPQIGVDLRVVIFGVDRNPRYPDAEQVPWTVLINPVLTPLSTEIEEGWEGCLSVPGLRGWVPRWSRLRYTGFDAFGRPIERSRRRLPRPRRATRMRPPRRHSLSDADQGFQSLRFRRRALPRGECGCCRVAAVTAVLRNVDCGALSCWIL